MSSMTTAKHGWLERPDTPAQWYAAVAGLFLVALGVLSLIIEGVNFGSVGANPPQFIIWAVSGWTTILWIAMGAYGLMSVPRLDGARAYALIAGLVFAAYAIWGFIDGSSVASIFAADTTDNITHAILGGLGLLVALTPRAAQRPHEHAQAAGAGRFSHTEQSVRERQTIGRS
jgi:hypothetical protein